MPIPELSEPSIQPLLQTSWLGRSYIFLPEVGSTNDYLREQKLLPHGTVIATDYQSAGRGRLDRRWEAPPATALLFSILLRPDWPAERAIWLTMIAGVAVAAAVEEVATITVGLKWPNDLVVDIDGEWHKVCGVLLDTSIDANGRLETTVLGVGLNVNIPAESLPQTSFPATSLLAATGWPVSRPPLLAACLRQVEQQYDAAERGRSPWALWNERLMMLGQPVAISRPGEEAPLLGIAEATEEDGALLVLDANGRLHRVVAGDVSLRLR